MRTPRQKPGYVELSKIVNGLLNDKVVDHRQKGGGKAKLGKHQVNAIHTEREFIPEFAQVRLFEAGPVGNDEGAFALVNILQCF